MSIKTTVVQSLINRYLHQILLPRGRQFALDQALLVGWNRQLVTHNNRSINVLYKAVDGAKHTVILAHPYVADAHQFYQYRGYDTLYLDMGCNVILFDFNGFGESPFYDFSYDKDWNVAAAFAVETFPVTKIVGHGISFGGSHTISYATHNDYLVDKFIIENTLDSNLSYYKKRNIRLYKLMRALMKVSSRINANHDYIKSASLMKHNGTLFIYNDEDDLTTLYMGKQLMDNCPAPKRLEVFHGKHLEAFPKNEQKYKEVIRDFIFE